MQAHVGPAADHACGRARRIDHHAVEETAVPPARGVARVADDDLGFEAKPLQVLPDTRHTVRLGFHRDQRHRRPLQDVTGLAARCRACVEYTLAIGEAEQVGGNLRGTVLHGEMALGEARQAGDVGAVRQDQSVLQPGMEIDLLAGGARGFRRLGTRHAAAVRAQHQRSVPYSRRRGRLRPALAGRSRSPLPATPGAHGAVAGTASSSTSKVSRSRCHRRSTALTSPASRGRRNSRTASTVAATAA